MGAVTSANPSSPSSAQTPWGLVILLGLLTAMGPLAIDMYLPSLPAIGAALKADPSQTQATLATFLAGMALGQMFYGPASDRLGRRGPILFGVAVFVLASAGCAMAQTIDQLMIARFVQALGACAGGVVVRAVVRVHPGFSGGNHSSAYSQPASVPINCNAVESAVVMSLAVASFCVTSNSTRFCCSARRSMVTSR